MGEVVFCMHCGANIPAAAQFCPTCGKPQNSLAAPSAGTHLSGGDASRPEQVQGGKAGGGRLLAIVLGGALVLVLAAVAIVASGILSPGPSDAANLWCGQNPGAVYVAAMNLHLDLKTDVKVAGMWWPFDSLSSAQRSLMMAPPDSEMLARWRANDSGTYNRACEAAFGLR